MKPLLTTAEAAAVFNLAPKTLRNWRCLQVGPPHVKHRGRVYYRSEDLQSYVDSLQFAA